MAIKLLSQKFHKSSSLNSDIKTEFNVLSINSGAGISLVSANSNCYFAGVYYVDVSIQLTGSIPNQGSIFQLVRDGKAVSFSARKDAILIGISEDPKIYDTWLAPGTDAFVVNGATIPAGFYKLIAVVNK